MPEKGYAATTLPYTVNNIDAETFCRVATGVDINYNRPP
jgi:hypothetical protein